MGHLKSEWDIVAMAPPILMLEFTLKILQDFRIIEDRQTDGHTDRQTDRWIQTDRLRERQTDTVTDRQDLPCRPHTG